MGASATKVATSYVEYFGCSPIEVAWSNLQDAEDDFAGPVCIDGWAGLPPALLVVLFRTMDQGVVKQGHRPRIAAGNRATDQGYDLGTGLSSSPTVRLVCRAWRRAHDSGTTSLRPRELDEDALQLRFPNLTALDLGRVAFPQRSAVAALLKRQRRLQTLTMRDNGTGHLMTALVCSALSAKATRLATLNLGENHIDDRGAASLAEALRGGCSLTALNVRDNGITAAGAAALAASLPASGLLLLDLSLNSVSVSGAVALAAALETSSLAERRLGSCNNGDDGARVLGGALPRAPKLRALVLPANGIGCDGAAFLGYGLASCAIGVQLLDLSGNFIRDRGAAALAEALPTARSLTALNLFDNCVGDEGAIALSAALGFRGACLQKLHLSTAGLSADAVARVQAAGPRIVTAGAAGRPRPAVQGAAPPSAPTQPSAADWRG